MNLKDQQLVAAAFEGALGEPEFRELQEKLGRDDRLLDHYREQALLHHSLAEEFEGRQAIGRSVPPPARRGGRRVAWLGAVAAMAAAGVWLASRPPKPAGGAPPAASCSFSADVIARLDDRPAQEVSGFRVGSRLVIERGWVKLDLPSKTRALVEAPAAVAFESGDVLRLEEGRARFHCPAGAHGFTVKTASLEAVDLGTDFGVVSRPGGSDELHVFRGQVSLKARSAKEASVLGTRQAAAVSAEGELLRMEAREGDFESLDPEVRLLVEDRFDTGPPAAGRMPAAGDSPWRLEKGAPELRDGVLTGRGYELFLWLPRNGLSAARPVLLATLETAPSEAFHTPGWAGFSLYQDGYEYCFFGDSFGSDVTWSLDVKRRFVPLVPAVPLTGPRTMTLRYDRRDGSIELHEGASAGDRPVIRSRIEPGLTFDQIRLGASEEATLAVSSLAVRAVMEPQRR